VIDAVFSAGFDELLDVQGRVEALAEAKGWKDFESIVIASKRAINILKGASPAREMNPALFHEPAEQNLYQSFVATRETVETRLKKRDYRAALLELTRLKPPVDEFFDRVMVMVEDQAIRGNRLALLEQIGQVCGRIADFSKLS
jgi:glycyl-tRNA synthetase beta chain